MKQPPAPIYYPQDQLTGLPARQSFLVAFEKLAVEAQSGHLAMVAVDIDCFLAFMNAEGWFTGDKLLLELAKVVETHAPLRDCSMRQGDAFLFALTTSDSSSLREEGQKLLQHVQAVLDEATTTGVLGQLKLVRRTRLTSTVAVAVAELPGRYGFEPMVEVVHLAMAEGKRAGGGRVVVNSV